MVPRLVPEILELDAFCDGGAAAAGAAAGIGDSRSWMQLITIQAMGCFIVFGYYLCIFCRKMAPLAVSIELMRTTR